MSEQPHVDRTPWIADSGYASLIQGAGDAILVHDATGTLIDANHKACESLGYTREELLGAHITDIDPDAASRGAEPYWTRALSGEQITFESRHRRKDGTSIPVEVTLSSLAVADGQLALAIVRDISKRKEREDEYRQLIDAMNDTVFVIDFDAHFLEVNARATETLGYSRGELLSMGPADIDPFLRREEIRALAQGMKLDQRQIFRTEHKTKDGRIIPVEVSSSLVSHGGREAILSIARDISERKKAEDLLRMRTSQQTAVALLGQEALAGGDLQRFMNNLVSVVSQTLDVEYTSVLELLPDRRALMVRAGTGWRDGIVGRYVVANGLDSLAGYTLSANAPVIVEDLQGESRFGIPQNLHDHGVTSGLTATIAGPLSQFGVLSALSREHRRFNEDDVHFLQATANVLAAAIQRKQVEQALRESEARYRQLFDASPDAVFVIDADGRYVDCNQTAVDRYGYTRSEILELVAGDLTSPETRAEVQRQVLRAMAEGTAFEWSHLRKDGSEIPVEVRVAPLTMGGQAGVLSTVRDITERKHAEEERERLQAQLYQAVKMESVGRLAGGVAHDFNNMLGVILGHAELVIAQVDPSEPLYASLQEIRKAADHSARITQQLLAFARRQIIVPKMLDLNESVEGMLVMLQRLIGEDIQLIWTPGAGLGPVRIDPSQVDQVLANLCINARDAIRGDGPGSITIETLSVIADEEFCARHEECTPGEYALLRVSDTGPGMDQETLSHLFEPFFTTKGVGQGTGLGLATVYGIVKQNRGFVLVESQPGHGASFDVYLPVFAAEEPEQQPAVAPTSALPKGHGELLLVVEDETALLSLAETILTGLGYEVLTASAPSEALALAEAHQGKIALLVTDVVMPEMNGEDLARRVQGLQPGLKVLYMSGYAADMVSNQEISAQRASFLQKPFASRELSIAVRNLLEQK
jgi:two-component system cell cycle sensor histidine kinase/response regulator CckA